MARILTSVLHGLLAASSLFVAFLVAVQCATAVAWEQGLYGGTSVITQAWAIVAVLLAVFGATQATVTVGWLANQRWGGVGLLILSGFLTLIVPPPIVYLVIAGAFAIAVDLLRPRPPQPTET